MVTSAVAPTTELSIIAEEQVHEGDSERAAAEDKPWLYVGLDELTDDEYAITTNSDSAVGSPNEQILATCGLYIGHYNGRGNERSARTRICIYTYT